MATVEAGAVATAAETARRRRGQRGRAGGAMRPPMRQRAGRRCRCGARQRRDGCPANMKLTSSLPTWEAAKALLTSQLEGGGHMIL